MHGCLRISVRREVRLAGPVRPSVPCCFGAGRCFWYSSVSSSRCFWAAAAAGELVGDWKSGKDWEKDREQQAAAGSRQLQAAAGSRQQQAAADTRRGSSSSSSSSRQRQAAAKLQFYSRVSEVTLGPFLGFLCYVLGTKLGGVLLFRMCFEKGVWLFVSCFGGCLIAAAPQQQQQPPAAAPAAGSSKEQQAGSSRQAAAGSSR